VLYIFGRGKARRDKLSAWRRKQIARMGGIARWAGRPNQRVDKRNRATSFHEKLPQKSTTILIKLSKVWWTRLCRTRSIITFVTAITAARPTLPYMIYGFTRDKSTRGGFHVSASD
jgi:hypothetical protein